MTKLILPDNLWKHQRELIEKSHDRVGYGYFLEQGTGKTLSAITQLRNAFQTARRPLKTLILCPNIVVRNWEDEINKFSMCGKYVQLLRGSRHDRIKQMDTPDKFIFVTNFEALDMEGLFWDTSKSKKGIPVNRGFEMLIVDESHRFKNPDAKRTKRAIVLSDLINGQKRILTGTPILNSPLDIWAQFRIMDGGKTFGNNFFAFRGTYFIDKNAGMPSQRHFPNWQLRPGAEEQLNKLIYSKATRVEKKDCLDLPPLVMQRVYAEMGKDQAKFYREMERDLITYVRSEACVATMALTKSLRLQQIASGYVKAESGETYQLIDVPRLKALEEILEDNYQRSKIIVWSVFQDNYTALRMVCEKLKINFVELTGLQTQKEKDESVKRFRGDQEVRVILAAPSAGGTGVNLTESDLSVWYSRSFSLGDRLQALARNHRGGSEQHDKITNIDIVCPGTIDEHVLSALDSKQSIAENILQFTKSIYLSTHV